MTEVEETVHGEPQRVKRLFIAHRIMKPEVRTELLQAWRKVVELLPAWSKPRRELHPHITLRFIGDVDTGEPGQRGRMNLMEQDIRKAAHRHRRIPLLLGDIRTFPGVAWSAADGQPAAMERLRRLQEEVDRAVRQHGFPPAEHSFQPHITLGTFDAAATQVLEAKLTAAAHPAQLSLELGSLELLESVRCPLGGETDHIQASPAMLLRGYRRHGEMGDL